jgi:hypothetical protein
MTFVLSLVAASFLSGFWCLFIGFKIGRDNGALEERRRLFNIYGHRYRQEDPEEEPNHSDSADWWKTLPP